MEKENNRLLHFWDRKTQEVVTSIRIINGCLKIENYSDQEIPLREKSSRLVSYPVIDYRFV